MKSDRNSMIQPKNIGVTINPDKIVSETSELLASFFADKTITPIHKRKGVDWKSRTEELKLLSNFILMPENPITAILGVAGSGKTTLLEMLSTLSTDKEARKHPAFSGINRYFVYSLKLGSIQKLDNYQDYINNVIDDLAVAEKKLQTHYKNAKVVLFIDELHQLAFSLKTGSKTGGDALKEKLATSPIAVIGATTRIEFTHAFSNDQAFRERWNILQLPQLSREKILEALRVRWGVFVKGVFDRKGAKVWEQYIQLSLKKRKDGAYEKYFRLATEKGCNLEDVTPISEVVPDLSDETYDELLLRNAMYRPEMGEPRKSMRIMEAMAVNFFRTGKVPQPIDVLQIFKEWFKIDTEFDVKAIIKNINRRLKGQDFAKQEIKQALYYAKLRSKSSPFRPVMTLLFAGSTGVGKTETVKAIAEVYAHNADGFTNFNMPDFSGKDGEAQFRQLLGEYAENNPNGIILLDEVEKAPNVFNALLSITDEGIVNYYLTAETGAVTRRIISLRNNIIIMTSNSGADVLRDNAKLKDRRVANTLKDEERKIYDRSSSAQIGKSLKNHLLKTGFTPELYNRFDRVIVFDNLDNKTYLEIGDSIVDSTAQTIQDSFGVEIQLKKKAIYRNASQESYDISAFILMTRMDETDTDMGGARGMIKNVGNLMSDYLLEYIYENDLVGSNKVINVSVGKNSRLYVDGVDEYRDELRIEQVK
jgi:ATP-dependent Clp protease ATP-binding subunit ClpC